MQPDYVQPSLPGLRVKLCEIEIAAIDALVRKSGHEVVFELMDDLVAKLESLTLRDIQRAEVTLSSVRAIGSCESDSDCYPGWECVNNQCRRKSPEG